jgi:hypothetical protein
MFHFPAFASNTYEFSIRYPYIGWVAPFGHQRIIARLLAPRRFRQLQRPSSPLIA